MAKTILPDGSPTTADDPERMVWYAAFCGYWTDDWDKLKLFGPGIPGCPRCSCPGMQIGADEWFDGAEKFDAQNPGYLDFIKAHKEKCYRHYPKGLMTVWAMHCDSRESSRGKDENP